MTRYGLPICKHIELGQQLAAIHNQLVNASVTLGNNYPKSSRTSTLANRALEAVDKLRSELDNVSASENPGDDQWAPTIYYGNNERVWEREVLPILAQHQAENPDCGCIQARGRR